MINVLITGANGQLGECIKLIAHKYSNIAFTYTDVDNVDVTKIDQIEAYVAQRDFDFIINCAAYTAVDKAEHEKTKSKLLNATAIQNIGIVAAKHKVKVIHISTDYVFGGKKCSPYKETDLAVPESYYGETKLLGEKLLMQAQPNSIIIRTAWLYSSFGVNFVKTIIKHGKQRDKVNVVIDQIGTPTNGLDLAKVLLTIIITNFSNDFFAPGIYHFTNEGICSWYDFAQSIYKIAGVDCEINPIPSTAYPSAAPRPLYGVLDKTKIKKTYNLKIPYWIDSLESFLLETKNK